MSVREGNRLLVVNTMIQVVFGDEAVEQCDMTRLQDVCRSIDFGEDKKKIHFRVRTFDRSVRLEIKEPECVVRVVSQLITGLAETLQIKTDVDVVKTRVNTEVVPHIRAYVNDRKGVNAESMDVDVMDSVFWLAQQIDGKIDRGTVEQLLAKIIAPPRRYHNPRNEQEFQELERVYETARKKFKMTHEQ